MLYSILDRIAGIFQAAIRTLTETSAGEEPAQADPLAHPDIRRMSLRELADLPFDPYDQAEQNRTDRQR
jgi:hypothetical protein